MATSGEFRFLTLGLLLVVVGLTGAEIATSEELTLEEIESWSWFPDDALVEVQGYVYLIEEDNPGAGALYFKIGKTVDPNKRISDLQTGNPRKLNMRYWPVRDHTDCENKLKTALRNYRSRLGGGTEWYTASANSARSLKAIFSRTVSKC